MKILHRITGEVLMELDGVESLKGADLQGADPSGVNIGFGLVDIKFSENE